MTDFNQVVGEVVQTIPRNTTDAFSGSQDTTLPTATIGDYWQWAYSDIIGNTNRGALAEFIVSRALATMAPVRNDWAAYDLESPTGVRVEVKSSAYLQSWHQREFSRPLFGINKSLEWSPKTNDYAGPRRRHSDVYVFCLLAFKGEKRRLNPMDLKQWEFYVVGTPRIDHEFGERKSVSLAQVQRLSRAYAVDELAQAVETVNINGERSG